MEIKNKLQGGEISRVGVVVNLTSNDRTIIGFVGILFAIYLASINQILPAIATLIVTIFWVSK